MLNRAILSQLSNAQHSTTLVTGTSFDKEELVNDLIKMVRPV